MNVQQKLDVRKAFKLRIHESNGNAFEDLFLRCYACIK